MTARQPDLFGASADRYPHAPGHRGVDTSVIAAESMRRHMTPLHNLILAFLRSRGATGATYTEIMSGCDLGAPTTAARMRELVLLDKVKISNERRMTPSNRPARVYVLETRETTHATG